MELKLHTIKPAKESRAKHKRIGRGGKRGTYSGKGQKGQRARSGGRKGLKLKGLKRMVEGLPKQRGFTSLEPKFGVVNIGEINKRFKDGETVTPASLRARGLSAKLNVKVKILGDGELTKKLTIQGCGLSKSALEKVQKAGGEVAKKKN